MNRIGRPRDHVHDADFAVLALIWNLLSRWAPGTLAVLPLTFFAKLVGPAQKEALDLLGAPGMFHP
jgi:hypothetical protein